MKTGANPYRWSEWRRAALVCRIRHLAPAAIAHRFVKREHTNWSVTARAMFATGLIATYDHDNLLEKKQTRVLIEKLIPNKKTNDGADLLLRFSFDDSGITWDIFQKGRTIVHAQPVF